MRTTIEYRQLRICPDYFGNHSGIVRATFPGQPTNKRRRKIKMALTRFIAQKELTRCVYRGICGSQVRLVTLKASTVVPESLTETHDERNARLNRPQSPHLSIYKPQVTSMMSISHRITGMTLSAYIMSLGLGALVLPNDFPHYLQMLEDLHLGSGTLVAGKFLLAFPLGYHYCNGIRHLIWDSGKGLTIRDVYVSGYITLALAIALTSFLATL